jgi:mannose-6-phosphate isomerase-like protein (cupin superfamily)
MTVDLEKRVLARDGKVRRVVTGLRDGKSVVMADSEVPAQDLLGSKIIPVWATAGTPVMALESEKHKNQFTFKMPGPGGTLFLLVSIPPDTDEVQPGSGMHRTKTVDYDIILSGELWMQLDDGVEVHLQPGDCVIQTGTRHAWCNRGKNNCLMLSVCIGAD